MSVIRVRHSEQFERGRCDLEGGEGIVEKDDDGGAWRWLEVGGRYEGGIG